MTQPSGRLPEDGRDALLPAVIGRIFPADRDPGAVELGAHRYVADRLALEARELAEPIRSGLAGLDRSARSTAGAGFAELDAARQDALLAEVAGTDWFRALADLTAEGVFANPGNGGNADAAAWRMVGYRHGLPEGPDGPPRRDPAPVGAVGPLAGATEFDVVVVGAGAGGGIAACVLAEAGKRVLLIERGHARSYADSGHRDHLRNHRLPLYGHNTGPALDGNPRVLIDIDGRERIVRPNEIAYSNNASCVGSGTFVYGGMAWRLHPDDFRMASRYGVPDGSSLADWPLGYEDLAPWYERAEWEIGVAGDAEAMPGPRRRPYPMPPPPARESARVLRRGAERLGLATFAPPLLINTVPRDGRPACIECGSCVGFPCPSDAKNGTQNTVIPRALATGNCALMTGATVARVETDAKGRVTGVAVIGPDGERSRVRAGAVVLSCGAIETARLLLLSASSREPAGLGNDRDLVGRNLQGHFYPTAFGLFEEEVHTSLGPGVTIGTCDFNHGNPGIIGGALLADDFVMPPAIFWRQALPPDLSRWGTAAKAFMRDGFRRVGQVKGPVHEIPDPGCRVTLDPRVRDAGGLPVARLSGAAHPETMRSIAFILGRAEAWLDAAGALRTWSTMPAPRLSAQQHQAGTCRMGTDPAHSVTDGFGRVWGHDNLFVCDASLHPTNGGYNPVLTIMAMAFRNADHIAHAL